MRFEIQSGPTGTKVLLHLGEDEGRGLAAGVESQARDWRHTLYERVRESGGLDSLQQLRDNLQASRDEQAELESRKQELLGERRLLLAQGANTATVQQFEKKKLRSADDALQDVGGRIWELERLIAAKMGEIGLQLGESQRDLQEELYHQVQRDKARLEKQILDTVGASILALVRLNRLAQSRGFDQQRFISRIANGDTAKIIEEYLGKLNASAEPAAAEMAAT
jgi:hypothetical protein